MKGKRLFRLGVILFLIPGLLAAVYAAYVFLSWSRLPDNMELEVTASAQASPEAGEPYRIVSWNIGFGAYEDDYSFFMDGGTHSRALSEERLRANLTGIGDFLAAQKADFLLVQEVDVDGTRSYRVNELETLSEHLGGYDLVFAQNYDSPYLFYPFSEPHGANCAGLATYSRFRVESALRRSLPVEDSLMKLLDLDRCYSISRVPLAGGGELVLYNLHLSAYTSDGTVATRQLELLLADMQREYDLGNYAVAGGDFNKDLLGDSAEYFGESDGDYSWAQPIPASTFENTDIALVAPFDVAAPVPSCRNADAPYHEGQYVLTVDGFLVSPNVTVTASDVMDLGFRRSDHNPVYIELTLKEH